MPVVVARASPSMNVHGATAGVAVAGTSGRRVESSATSLRESALGVWTRDAPHPRVAAQVAEAARSIPTFHEYASYWLQARTEGVLGDKPIEENTRRDYLLAPARASAAVLRAPPARRDRPRALLGPSRPTRSARPQTYGPRSPPERTSAIIAGKEEIVPLGPSSIRKLIDTLAAILDDAIEDGHIDRNPARGRRMRVRVPKPQRTLPRTRRAAGAHRRRGGAGRPLDADQDPHPQVARRPAKVAELLSRGKAQRRDRGGTRPGEGHRQLPRTAPRSRGARPLRGSRVRRSGSWL